VRWGGALLELAHHRQSDEALSCIHEVRTLRGRGLLDGKARRRQRGAARAAEPWCGPRAAARALPAHVRPRPPRPLAPCPPPPQAIAKLKEALALDPERTEALWCLGNAHTSLGFLQQSKGDALEQFDLAKGVFTALREKEPGNESYRKAHEMCEKAPEYYDEIQAQIQQVGTAVGGGGGGVGGQNRMCPRAPARRATLQRPRRADGTHSPCPAPARRTQAQAASNARGRGSGSKRASGAGGAADPLGLSDWVWDAAGWALLVAAIGGIAMLARSGAPPPAARP
jgi:hypothetical protein